VSEQEAEFSRISQAGIFEDIHCDKHYRFTVSMIGTIRGNRHYLTTEYDVLGIVSESTKDNCLPKNSTTERWRTVHQKESVARAVWYR
jgi:hypothetical protein